MSPATSSRQIAELTIKSQLSLEVKWSQLPQNICELPPDTRESIEIAAVLAQLGDSLHFVINQQVTVTVKVLSKRTMYSAGKRLQKQACIITDTNLHMRLEVWKGDVGKL